MPGRSCLSVAIAAKRLHLAQARQVLRQIDGGAVTPEAEAPAGPPAQFLAGAVVLLSGLTAAGYYPYRRFIMGDQRAPSLAWVLAGLALTLIGAVFMRRGRGR